MDINKLAKQLEKTAKFLLLLIILAGLFVRISYYISLNADPLPTLVSATHIFDQHRFIELAKEFLSNSWLGTAVTRYSPVYSYFIAIIFSIFGQDMYYVFFVQFLIGALIPILFYKTATILFMNQKVALLSALIAALYSPFIFFEGTLLRASLIAYLNLSSFYFLLAAFDKKKAIYYLFAGMALGFSTILRPNVLPIFLIGYIAFALRGTLKQKAIWALLFILGIGLFIAPLTVRNKILNKNVLISYQGSSTFWIGNTYDSSGIGLWRSPLRTQFAQEAKGGLFKTIGVLSREIKRHPKEYFHLYKRKIKMYFNVYEIPGNISYDQFVENHPPLRWAFFNFSIICPLAFLGIILCWKKFPYISLAYLYFIVLGVSNIIFHIQGRYRMPAIPFFILFASLAFYWLLSALKQKNIKLIVCGGFVVAISAFLTVEDPVIIKRYFGSRIRGIDFGNRFIAYYLLYKTEGKEWSLEQKRRVLSKAINDQNKELNRYPKEDNVHRAYVLAKQSIIYTEMEEYSNAKDVLERALKLDPEHKKELLEVVLSKDIYQKDTFKNLSFERFASKNGLN